MSLSLPQLDVFYIDFSTQKDKKGLAKLMGAAGASIVGSALIPVSSALIGTISLSSFLTPAIFNNVKGLIDNGRFYIIRSEEELNGFENPDGNAWKKNEKALRGKQYYIRHPKESKQHLLIESGSFFEHIEDEQIEELVHFIQAYCDAKVIRIERTELIVNSGKAKTKAAKVDVSVDAESKKEKKVCVNISNPNGFNREKPRENYYWLDKSVMQCVKSLTSNSVFERSYEKDFTFGLSVKEASTIGLNMKMHKNYSYSIHVETVENKQPLLAQEETVELKMRLKKIEEENKKNRSKFRFKMLLIIILAALGVAAAVMLAIFF